MSMLPSNVNCCYYFHSHCVVIFVGLVTAQYVALDSCHLTTFTCFSNHLPRICLLFARNTAQLWHTTTTPSLVPPRTNCCHFVHFIRLSIVAYVFNDVAVVGGIRCDVMLLSSSSKLLCLPPFSPQWLDWCFVSAHLASLTCLLKTAVRNCTPHESKWR